MENTIENYTIVRDTIDPVMATTLLENTDSELKYLKKCLDSEECKNNAIKLKSHAKKQNINNSNSINNTACN